MRMIDAMSTWIGALSRGGLLMGAEEAAGAELAHAVLGADALSRMRAWFAEQPAEVVDRERRGAFHACLWMAHADRELAPEERALLESLLARSDLGPAAMTELSAALEAPIAPDAIAERLTEPGLRALVLALAMQMALADRHVDDTERRAYDALAEAFDIAPQRAEELKAALPDDA